VLKSTNCSDIFEVDISGIVRPLLTVPNRGLIYENPVIVKKRFSNRFSYFNFTFKYVTRLFILVSFY
ncbi:unnamed protein product, partial [Thelazia callipaeda]|uniref:Uncharacterized protein n=1 Tax=Thelazia callipaeda TaxID=103827 RepID=A0A0N5DC11_THECL